MSRTEQMKIAFLTGPTGVGKTRIGIALAKKLKTEIISCDSMQVYKGMDIGTAKASTEEQEQVQHHLLDYVDPSERFTVQDYQSDAYGVMDAFQREGKLPLFVGGTGLYIDAVSQAYHFSDFDADFSFREQLDARYDREGGEGLLAELKEVDPLIASNLHPNDRKKIIRALEVYHKTKQPLGAERQMRAREVTEEPLPWAARIYVLTDAREKLYERIDRRVIGMLEDGLVEEVQKLLADGVDPHAQSMEAIGYKEVVWYLRGRISYAEMTALIQRFSRNYAKRQLTWWRKKDVIWLDRSAFREKLQRDIPNDAAVNDAILNFILQDLQEWQNA